MLQMRFVFFSLLLHALAFFLIHGIQDKGPMVVEPKPPIEVTLLPQKKDQVFLRSQEIPEKIKKTKEDKKTDLASKTEQSFEQESVTKKIGKVTGLFDSPLKSSSKKAFSQPDKQQAKKQLTDNGLPKPDFFTNNSSNPIESDSGWYSELNREPWLKDRPIGKLNILSTKVHTYYSYFKRINEGVERPWQEQVQAIMLRPDLETNNLSGVWETHMDIYLDQKGDFVKGVLIKPSGIRELDSAPIFAFLQAKSFPNPPLGLIDEDGFIRIRYSFMVYYQPDFRQQNSRRAKN